MFSAKQIAAILLAVSAIIFNFSLLWIIPLVPLLLFMSFETVTNVFRVFRRDFKLISGALKVKNSFLKLSKNGDTVVSLFRACVERHPDKKMFIGIQRAWTYQEAEDYTNQVANYFAGLGYQKGDKVALYMENRAEFVFLWLGLAKIGVVTALINNNLNSKPLAHSIHVSSAKALIFSQNTAKSVIASMQEIQEICQDILFYSFETISAETQTPITVIDTEISQQSTDAPTYRGSIDDDLIYIYTSGTTGLPKAAVIKHRRYIYIGLSVSLIVPMKPDDVIYHYLPFYHLAAGVLGCTQSIMTGLTGVIVPKFSSSRFWDDCCEHKVTVCQYIGEVARYLLMQPERASETQHSIRVMFGNGLRTDIWRRFQARYKIKQICEVYGSTEGNAVLVNIDNTVGSIGSLPILFKYLGKQMPITLIKVDPISGVPVRTEQGRCVETAPFEIGEIVAAIANGPAQKFDGYLDKEATRKKVYKDCFRPGDSYFSSGDLAYRDKYGYVFFKDRTGDTFRWKGENVSTTEVEFVINSILKNPSIVPVVYGVNIPHTEGKAGMLTVIDSKNEFCVETFAEQITEKLPSYAVPLFVRVARSEDLTGTYKISKIKLKKYGFDFEKCVPDPVFFFDRSGKKFIRIDHELLDRINKGQIRL